MSITQTTPCYTPNFQAKNRQTFFVVAKTINANFNYLFIKNTNYKIR